jgi:molybdate transport system substrate-binding protein
MSLFRGPILALFLCAATGAQTIRVGVAISLKEAMTDLEKTYESQQQGDKVELIYGSSGQIQAHIINGANLDVFISAANQQVDDLIQQGLVLHETRRIVAGNSVVLVVPADAKDPPVSFESLAGQTVKRIAIGDPKSVPAGAYAMQVLKSLNVADRLADRIVYGSNVRQVLSYVERGEVSAGIVYGTDARESGSKVRVVAVADAKSHEPVVYPAVMIKASTHQDASRRFLEFLSSDKAQSILTEKGFSPHPNQPTTHPAE